MIWFSPNVFDGLTRGMSNLCETASLITSSSASGVKQIGFSVLCSSFVSMESRSKLDVVSLEIYPTLLQNTSNLLNPDLISNYGRQFSESAVVFFYFILCFKFLSCCLSRFLPPILTFFLSIYRNQ